MFRLAIATACLQATLSAPANVLFIIVDNFRPEIGAYGVQDVLTPQMDKLAAEGTVFSRAYCQIAWCSPSRNSFLTGRRPDSTQAWNFLDSFRDSKFNGGGKAWISFPEYFKQHGYFTASSGKVFHPNLPPNYDYPASWSIPAVLQEKDECPRLPWSYPASVAARYPGADHIKITELTGSPTAASLDLEWFRLSQMVAIFASDGDSD
eukprot:gene18330-30586_t